MDISNFFGLAPILMNEADSGEGAGGGTALATIPDTAVAVADGAGDVAGTGETGLTTTGDGAMQSAEPVTNPASVAIETLKAHENPEVKKFANTVIRDRAFRRDIGNMFPGQNPKAAVESLVSDMVSLAGRNYNTPDPRDATKRTGLQQVRDRLAEIEDIDLMFYSGKPELLDGMTADDEGKAAFAKLAPNMQAKWREIAPNAFAAFMSRQILADMKGAAIRNDRGEVVDDADIPRRIRNVSLALGKEGVPSEASLQQAREDLAYMAVYVHQLQTTASLAPEVFTQTTTAPDSKLAERERRLAEREAQNRNNDWNNARQTVANQTITKTWNQLTKGHTVSADDQEECMALFQVRYEAAIKAREPQADEKRQAYLDAEDRDGYLRFENNLMTSYGVPALKQQVQRMLTKLAPAKPGAQAAVQAAPGQPQAAVRPPAGFVKLPAKPPTHVLDYDKMRNDRTLQIGKQGILRMAYEGKPAGTKVTW